MVLLTNRVIRTELGIQLVDQPIDRRFNYLNSFRGFARANLYMSIDKWWRKKGMRGVRKGKRHSDRLQLYGYFIFSGTNINNVEIRNRHLNVIAGKHICIIKI